MKKLVILAVALLVSSTAFASEGVTLVEAYQDSIVANSQATHTVGDFDLKGGKICVNKRQAGESLRASVLLTGSGGDIIWQAKTSGGNCSTLDVIPGKLKVWSASTLKVRCDQNVPDDVPCQVRVILYK